jgi:sialic acid synthase
MVQIDYLKIASRDLGNVPLLREVASTRIPVILSSGMSGLDEVERAVEVVSRHHENITILHCISQYPSQYENIGLPRITELKQRFPSYTIGYSDHSVGIVVPVAAVCLGAQVIEKHITLSRQLKGSDHAGALEADGLWRMVRDIRNVERALRPVADQSRRRAAHPSQAKLRRSLAVRRPMKRGELLREDDLSMLSPGGGLTWDQRHLVLDKPLRADVGTGRLLSADDVEQRRCA